MKCDYDNCDKESGNIKPNNDLCELHNISQSRYEIESEIEQCRYEIKTQLENLDLLFEENLLYISNEIVYKNSNIMLEADKLELEILSKDIKIYMHDKNQKIQISGTY